MDRQWFVSGANGYLGKTLCEELHYSKKTVYGLIRPGKNYQKKRIVYYTYQAIPSVFLPNDVFIHCAGKVGGRFDWEEFVSINVEWTIMLFQKVASLGASCFVYISSVAALGYQNRFNGNNKLDESSEPQLLQDEFYGRSKFLAEQRLQECAKKTSTRLIILRPGLIYGHRPSNPPQPWLMRGIVVDPRQRLPLVHIANFFDALIKVVTKPKVKGVFFVVDEEQPSLQELNKNKIECGIFRYRPWLVGRLGFWILLSVQSIRRTLRPKIGSLPITSARIQYNMYTRKLTYSTNKLRIATGWEPKVTLIQGIKQLGETKTSLEATENHADA